MDSTPEGKGPDVKWDKRAGRAAALFHSAGAGPEMAARVSQE